MSDFACNTNTLFYHQMNPLEMLLKVCKNFRSCCPRVLEKGNKAANFSVRLAAILYSRRDWPKLKRDLHLQCPKLGAQGHSISARLKVPASLWYAQHEFLLCLVNLENSCGDRAAIQIGEVTQGNPLSLHRTGTCHYLHSQEDAASGMSIGSLSGCPRVAGTFCQPFIVKGWASVL